MQPRLGWTRNYGLPELRAEWPKDVMYATYLGGALELFRCYSMWRLGETTTMRLDLSGESSQPLG